MQKYTHANPVGIGVAKSGGRVKKEIKNREGFMIQVFRMGRA
jgi:hypothetical protein